ncbi:MAG: PEP-CTERM sorting domain-containing protein [Acidobacteria bacterium]|nr:PEP-CTERM sorting domain-containing protein [Acidobacteriota bacterium]
MNFLCNPALGACPLDYGNFIVTQGTNDFVAVLFTGGLIHSLNQATEPINEPFLLLNFMFFAADPDIALHLTFIPTGVSGQADCFAAPATGQTCTPVIPALVTAANPLGLSPFNLQNLPGAPLSSTASFAVAGIAERISTGELSNFVGRFSASFGVPYQNLLLQLGAGETITSPYEATFEVTVIPEPGTTMLMLGGLLVFAGSIARRRVRK